MIKYIHVPDQRKTIAVLQNTAYDAILKINKILAGTSLVFDPDKYIMNKAYRAVVVCHPGDEYSKEEGENQAKEKLLDKYYGALDEKMNLFYEDCANVIERWNKYVDIAHNRK